MKYGVLAQLVERQVRNLEVRGSTPLCSTKTRKSEHRLRNRGRVRIFSFLVGFDIKIPVLRLDEHHGFSGVIVDSLLDTVLTCNFLRSDRVANICLYGIITTNPKTQQTRWFRGLEPAFSSVSKREKDTSKT